MVKYEDGEELLTYKEASKLLHRSRRTIERYAAAGYLTRIRRGISRAVYFKRSQVEGLNELREEPPPEEK